MQKTEYHPLEPFLPENARVLFLGSFPPPRQRWSMDFFYPNFINDFWRIIGLVFYGDREHFIIPGAKRFDRERIMDFCKKKGIALFDTATEVRRLQDNASDKFLEVVTPTDLPALLARIPACRAVATTGQKAADVLAAAFGCPAPPVGGSVSIVIPPSSSPTDIPLDGNSHGYCPSNSASPDSIFTTGVSPDSVFPTADKQLDFYRMPSTSRAYPLPLERKAESYRHLFANLGLI